MMGKPTDFAAGTDDDRSAVLWYSAEREVSDSSEKLPTSVVNSSGRLLVEVLFFGLLSAVTTERSIKLNLPASATSLDVLTALEERYGADAFSTITDPVAGILPCCRLFVDGEPIEDVRAPISPEGKPATMEMILIKGFEGG